MKREGLNHIPTDPRYIYPSNLDPWLALAFRARTPVDKFGIPHIEKVARDRRVIHDLDEALLVNVAVLDFHRRAPRINAWLCTSPERSEDGRAAFHGHNLVHRGAKFVDWPPRIFMTDMKRAFGPGLERRGQSVHAGTVAINGRHGHIAVPRGISLTAIFAGHEAAALAVVDVDVGAEQQVVGNAGKEIYAVESGAGADV